MTARPPACHRLTSPATADGDLLRAYAATADPSALAELAGRYAGLARRAAADVFPPAADDAAQAVLVLLGRRAAAVADRDSAAGWVFEAARRLARKARTAAARRTRHEAQAPIPGPSPDPLDALTLREVRVAVAEEVARLPDALRTPLVLCYWEGASRPAAAARVGCSESTLKRRLDAGRDRLAARLAGRGFAGPAVLATLAAVQASGRATAPPAVAAAACGSVPLSAGATALLRAAGRWAVAGRLATAAVMLAVGTGLAVVGAGTGGPSPAAGATPAAPPPTKPAPPDAPAGGAADAHGDPLPPGAVARLGTTRFRLGMWPRQLAPAPDGTRLATFGYNHGRAEHLDVWDLASGRPARRVAAPGVEVASAQWLPGGRGFAVAKVAMADYAVWEFTDPAAPPPPVIRPDEMNRTGPGTFTAAAVSPDGRLVAGGQRAGDEGNLGRLEVWTLVPNGRVREMKQTWAADFDGVVAGLHFSPDALRLAVVTRRKEPDRPDPTVRQGPIPLVMGAAADKVVVSVRAADTGAELVTFAAPVGPVLAAGPSPDGATLYLASPAGRVTAYDLATGKPRRTYEPGAAAGPAPRVGLLAISEDGGTLLAAADSGLAAFDAATGAERWRTTDREFRSVYALAALPGGRFAVGAVDGAVLVLDAATGRVTNEQPGPRGHVTAVAVADGGRSAVTGENNFLRRWELATGRETGRVAVGGGTGLRVLGLSPDGRRMLGDRWEDKAVVVGLFDAATGGLVTRLPEVSGEGLSGLAAYGGRPLDWLPDGSVVVAAGDAAARFGPDGREVRGYAAGKDGVPAGGRVAAVAASPDGRELVLAGTGPGDGFRRGASWVAVYDAATGTARRRWEPATQFKSAAYTPDGTTVVLCGWVSQPPRPVEQPPAALDLTAAVVAFDPATGRAASPFAAPDPAATFRAAAALAMSPTGAQFAVAEADHTLTVYETASGAIRRRLAGHRNTVYQLAFTPDGRRLVSASGDGTGLVWDVSPPRPAGAAAGTDDSRRAAAWESLAGADAEAAHRAMGTLAADPAGVAFLKESLRPGPAVGVEQWGRLDGPRLRERRAVEVLEGVGTAEARAVLTGVAGTGTLFGREAAAAVARLGKR